MSAESCTACRALRDELARANAALLAQRAELATLKAQLVELDKLNALQQADLERYKKTIEDQPKPHQPERVTADALQLGLEGIIEVLEGKPLAKAVEKASTAANEEADSASPPPAEPSRKPRRSGNRRNLLEASLPIIRDRIDPDEVVAGDFRGWRQVESQMTRNVARRSAYVVLEIERRVWVRKGADGVAEFAVAPLPASVLPSLMADASVVASVVLDKYGASQPLHRQEQTSAWRGFHLPRSTQSDWCDYADRQLSPIVAAMHAESLRDSYTIATDATGAPVRANGRTNNWHLFVFIGDVGHITFRPTRHHNSVAIQGLLQGFMGRLLSDASSIYDCLRALGIVSVACWVHARRYFWKATQTESRLAHEALALIDALFKVDAASKKIPKSGRVTTRSYDAEGRLQTVINPANETWTYCYGELGQLIAQTDPLGRTTRIERDQRGRELARVYPPGGWVTGFSRGLLYF